MNYADILLPQRSVPSRVINFALVIGTSWLIAISAQISINIPFSPVPVTGQTLVILLAGLFLGKTLGTAAVAAYLVQGAAGLPVFAGGKSGFVTLIGPTGGYLFGFLAAVYFVGLLSELRHKRSLFQAASALVIGNIIIYGFGLLWLARFVGETRSLELGLFPFLIGDTLKILLGIVIVGGGSVLIKRINPNRN
jgi:biotin transport system substrate-specific component